MKNLCNPTFFMALIMVMVCCVGTARAADPIIPAPEGWFFEKIERSPGNDETGGDGIIDGPLFEHVPAAYVSLPQGFADPVSEWNWSYLAVWEASSLLTIDSDTLSAMLSTYYDRLTVRVQTARNKELSRVPLARARFEQGKDAMFRGGALLNDSFSTQLPIALNIEAQVQICSTDQQLIILRVSPKRDREGKVWQMLKQLSQNVECTK